MYVRVQLLYFPLVRVPYVRKKQLPILVTTLQSKYQEQNLIKGIWPYTSKYIRINRIIHIFPVLVKDFFFI